MTQNFDLRSSIRALSEKYEVHRILGRGSMGAVLLARDRILDRLVALKIMRPQLLADPEVRDAFLQQAKAMAKVRHANVVEIFELKQSQAGVYFAMQYIDGVNLASFISANRDELSVDDGIAILEPLCKGVHAIHAAGTTHGDLSPGNIMIGPSFRVAVTDLGFSLPGEDVQRAPEYEAPELAAGGSLDPELQTRCDIYSLGCIAYELLVGRPPFDAAERDALRHAHAHEAPVPPSQARAGLAEEFDEPILAALHKDPRQRTATAEEFRKGLLAARDVAAERLDWGMNPFDVLIVDDDPDMLDWLELQLAVRFPDANVRRAENGLEAMEMIDIAVPDIVITDLDMPGLNGVELTRHLRTTLGGEHTPLIVITAVGGAPDWQRLQALGASGFHFKPIDPDALAALVRKQLGDLISD
jgi:serine/threonine-protein kinase